MLYLKCKGQVMSVDVDERIADQYINANTVHFEFCERWNGMTITAQFTQTHKNEETGVEESKTYNKLIDEVTNTVILPNEIVAGKVEISAFGVHPTTGVRLTSIPVKKTVDKSGFVGDGEQSVPPTPDLYAQLLEKVNKTAIPHIGANGNWWFDDWDSGVAATAEVDAARQAAVNEINRAAANQMVEMDNKFANTMQDIPETYTELDATVKSLKDTKAPAIEVEASGSIITIDDAAAMNVRGLVSTIKPVQAAGTPSPDNPLPISGWNEVMVRRSRNNLFPGKINGTSNPTNVRLGAGTYTLSQESGTPDMWYVRLMKNGEIVTDDKKIGGAIMAFSKSSYWYYSSAGNNSLKITLDDTYDVQIAQLNADGTINGMLNAGDTALPYEPYQGRTLTAALPQTVYGGTLDWKTGVLTVDFNYVDLGAYDWTYAGSGRFYANVIEGGVFPKANMVCSAYKTSYAENHGNAQDGEIWSRYYAYSSKNVIIRNSAYEDAEAFKASLSGVMLAYKTGAPRTIQLTPQQLETLKGLNNVWSDCGDTSIVYVADTKIYIDKKFDALAAALLS